MLKCRVSVLMKHVLTFITEYCCRDTWSEPRRGAAIQGEGGGGGDAHPAPAIFTFCKTERLPARVPVKRVLLDVATSYNIQEQVSILFYFFPAPRACSTARITQHTSVYIRFSRCFLLRITNRSRVAIGRRVQGERARLTTTSATGEVARGRTANRSRNHGRRDSLWTRRPPRSRGGGARGRGRCPRAA